MPVFGLSLPPPFLSPSSLPSSSFPPSHLSSFLGHLLYAITLPISWSLVSCMLFSKHSAAVLEHFFSQMRYLFTLTQNTVQQWKNDTYCPHWKATYGGNHYYSSSSKRGGKISSCCRHRKAILLSHVLC